MNPVKKVKEVQSTYVFHCSDEDASAVIDGRLIVIPPNELYEVEEIRGTDVNNNGKYEYIIPVHKVIERLLQHCWHFGLVVVPMTRTVGGVTSDLDAAKKMAFDARIAAEDTMLSKYISDQTERVTINGKAPIAPSKPIRRILDARGLDLIKDFNLTVPGETISKAADRDKEMSEMKLRMDKQDKENEELRRGMSQLIEKLQKAQK